MLESSLDGYPEASGAYEPGWGDRDPEKSVACDGLAPDDEAQQKKESLRLQELIDSLKESPLLLEDLVQAVDFSMRFDEFDILYCKRLCKLSSLMVRHLDYKFRYGASRELGYGRLLWLYNLAEYGIMRLEQESPGWPGDMYPHLFGHRASFGKAIASIVEDPSKWLKGALSDYLKAAEGSSGMAYRFFAYSRAGRVAYKLYQITGHPRYRTQAKRIIRESIDGAEPLYGKVKGIRSVVDRSRDMLRSLRNRRSLVPPRSYKTKRKMKPYNRAIRHQSSSSELSGS